MGFETTEESKNIYKLERFFKEVLFFETLKEDKIRGILKLINKLLKYDTESIEDEEYFFYLIVEYMKNTKNFDFNVREIINEGIKKEDVETFLLNSNFTQSKGHIFNVILTSPYLENKEKIDFYNNILDNRIFKEYLESYVYFINEPLLINEEKGINNKEHFFSLGNSLVLTNNNNIEIRERFERENSNTTKQIETLIYNFNFDLNKDKFNEITRKLLEEFKKIKYFFIKDSDSMTITNINYFKKILTYYNDYLRKIFLTEKLNNNLDENLKNEIFNFYDKLFVEINSNKDINENISNKNKDFFNTLASSFFDSYFSINEIKLKKYFRKKNNIQNFYDNYDFINNSVKSTRIVSTIINNNSEYGVFVDINLDRSRNIYCDKILLDNYKEETNSKKSYYYQKFINILSTEQDSIIYKNPSLYDYLKREYIVNEDSIPSIIEIAFRRNNLNNEHIEKSIDFITEKLSPFKYYKKNIFLEETKHSFIKSIYPIIANPYLLKEINKKDKELINKLFDTVKLLICENKPTNNITVNNNNMFFDKFEILKNFDIEEEFTQDYIIHLIEINLLSRITERNKESIVVHIDIVSEAVKYLFKDFDFMISENKDFLTKIFDKIDFKDFIEKYKDINKEQSYLFDRNSSELEENLFFFKNIINDFSNNKTIGITTEMKEVVNKILKNNIKLNF